MSIGVTLQVVGLDKLKKKFQEKNVTGPLNDGIKKATLLLDREVKMATPVITTRLQSSITSQYDAGFGQVGTNVEYAPVVEFGSDKMRARHIEGGARVYGEGMFAFGLSKLKDKMKELLGDVANKIESRWK